MASDPAAAAASAAAAPGGGGGAGGGGGGGRGRGGRGTTTLRVAAAVREAEALEGLLEDRRGRLVAAGRGRGHDLVEADAEGLLRVLEEVVVDVGDDLLFECISGEDEVGVRGLIVLPFADSLVGFEGVGDFVFVRVLFL